MRPHPGQLAELMHRELVKVARDKFACTPNELDAMAPDELRPDPCSDKRLMVVPTTALLAWALHAPAINHEAR